jgi:hypothetical protein
MKQFVQCNEIRQKTHERLRGQPNRILPRFIFNRMEALLKNITPNRILH